MLRMTCEQIVADFDAIMERVEEGEAIGLLRDGRVVMVLLPIENVVADQSSS